MPEVLILHPGEMGASLGYALKTKVNRAHWVSANRSESTHYRAGQSSMIPHGTLEEALDQVGIVISVCPPEHAVAVGNSVFESGFSGLFCDANAIAPSTARHHLESFGDRYVDGGIVGPPAYRQGTTRLYLSGAQATEVGRLFSGTAVDARVVDGDELSASAVKMCYAAYTKGTSAMLLAIRSLADAHGVSSAIHTEWDLSQPTLWERSERTGLGTTRKAWRFAPEMREIAMSFSNVGLPSGFHEAAAEIYSRMASLKDSEPVATRLLAKQLRGE